MDKVSILEYIRFYTEKAWQDFFNGDSDSDLIDTSVTVTEK
jgi:hypothetical protein